MDVKILLSIAWLSVCGLPRFVDCVPSWIVKDHNNKPYDGTKVYAIQDSEYTFKWQYNYGGYTVQSSKWKFLRSALKDSERKVIAYQGTGQSQPVISEYYNDPSDPRLKFIGGQMEIKRLKYPADEGEYEIDVTFTQNTKIIDLKDKAQLVVVVSPRILDKTAGPDITISEQDFITLQCAADGNPTPRIIWTRKNLDTGQVSYLLDSYNHFGYNITNAQRKDIGKYKCEAIISVDGGKISKRDSYEVTVYVKHKPEVISLTGNRTLTEGNNVELECIANGDPPVTKYHWFKDSVKNPALFSGGKYTITGSNVKSQLVINNLDKNDAAWYYCAAENSIGIGNGTGTYVSARYAPTKVQITYMPKQAVNLTQSITLKCISDGVPNPFFTWKFQDRELDPKVQVIDGKYNELVKISRMTRELTGYYTCKATNVHGESSTRDYLPVNYKPQKAYMQTDLPDLGALLNSRTKLQCMSDGYPEPDFNIKKYQGNNLVDTILKTDHIIFPSVKFADEQFSYTCTPFNFLGYGPESPKMKIKVIVRPSFIVGLQPDPKITITENQTKNYTCEADAKPEAIITWFVNNENVTGDKPYLGYVSTFYKSSPDNPGQIRTVSTLVIMSVSWRQDGNISCVASNGANPIMTYALLEVKHRPVVKNPEEVPNNETVSNGDPVTFTCFAVGNPAIQSYRWRFNGQEIIGANARTYSIKTVDKDDVGKYSCRGINTLGEGPWFDIALFIKIPAKITNHPDVLANESDSVTLLCEASGIPTPTIHWYRDNKYLALGNKLYLYNITYDDRGRYECRAMNELSVDKAYVTLSIRIKPNITSNKPTDTQIAGEITNTSTMTCKVDAIPRANIWWTRENENIELKPVSDRVISITTSDTEKTLKIRVNRIGERYYCHARNEMGYSKQLYVIRKKGRPDKPIELKAHTIKVPSKRTVDVNVTWTAGYSGGEPQYFTLLYKLYSEEGFTRLVLDNADITHYLIKELKPRTKYTFRVEARNTRGVSPLSDIEIYATEASALPPARGTLTVKRIEDGTKFQISWKAQKNVTAVYLKYREVKLTRRTRRNTDDYDYEYGRWNDVSGAQGLPYNEGSYTIQNLDKDKTYQIRILFKVGNEIGESEKMIVDSEIIQPLVTPKEPPGLKEDELIAIIAACGGFLLIVIVIVCLCCFMKRKKGYGADPITMSQTGSVPNLFSNAYDTSGTRGTTLRSFATSVEDDPFIDAHIANELSKKRKPENGVNHGYASQDSLPRQEILLNPGSRSGIRTGMSQSVGELGGRASSYSSSGPHKDFSALPPYNEPPSFEEAIRQSVKKSKHAALSTGDLTEAPRPYHGRGSRSRTPADSDTSDSEVPLNRRPMFKVKPPVPPNDKRYKSAPSIPPLLSPTRPAPRDPPSAYPRPQKKGPPPSYTPEDRALIPGMEDGFEPRVTKRRPLADDVMELKEQPSYHRNDRLPDLPPSMPDFSRGRNTMHKEPLGETLPEPPSFLRNLSYDDDEPDGRYRRTQTEPRNRNKQPYVNIHGQLVRPNTPGRQPTYGSDSRQEPIYANDPPRLVAAEPEVPVDRRNRQPDNNDHKAGYVSSGFLV